MIAAAALRTYAARHAVEVPLPQSQYAGRRRMMLATAALAVAAAPHAALAQQAQLVTPSEGMRLRVPAATAAEVRVVVPPGRSLLVEVSGDGASDFQVELRDPAGRLIDRDPDGSDKGRVAVRPANDARTLIVTVRNIGGAPMVVRLSAQGATTVALLRGGQLLPRPVPGRPPANVTPPKPTAQPTPPTDSPPGPAPSPVPTGSPFREYARLLADGVVGFDYPPRMRVGEAARIRLQVSMTKALNDLRAELQAPGHEPIVEPVKLSPIMRADLVGAGFEIARVGTAEQLVDAESDTSWSWDLVAKSAGRLRLTVTLTAIVRVDETDRARDVRTFHREVEVEATPGSTWQTLVRFVESYGPPAALVWPSIITGVGAAWVWIRRRSRKRRRR